jgi:flagellar FliL protein
MSGKSEAQAEAGDKGSGKKKGLLLIIGVGVLMLALGGGGAWFFLGSKKEGHATEAKAKPKDEHPPVFVTLDPFVVNLAGEVEHYLQVGINLKVADAKVPDQLKARMPEIRNAVLLLLSSKKAEELATLEGKNQLRAEVRGAVNRSLGIETPAPAAPKEAVGAVGEAQASEPAKSGEEPAAGVLDVLLTSFVIQ